MPRRASHAVKRTRETRFIVENSAMAIATAWSE